MNGTPQPNQKRPPALGIEPGSLDHESQPLTIRPLLTPANFVGVNPKKLAWFHKINYFAIFLYKLKHR